MRPDRSLSENIFLFAKGLVMGAANKVPGVSGGMVSFVLGFYEELIFSFQRINLKAFTLLLKGRFKSFFLYINARFLGLVLGGSIFSYFSVSQILDYLLKNYELYVWSWFFGMIIGSVWYIGKGFYNWNLKNTVAVFIGATLGVGISFLTPAAENDNLWFIFICGIVGVSGMTLPGLSGSFILILMGNYVLLLVDSVNELFSVITDVFSGDISFMNDSNRVRYLKIIGVFTAGSVFGLVFISHVLGYLLKRWNQIITAIIIGFITGSLGIVWPWKTKQYKVEHGEYLLDQQGNKIIENYQRFLPDLTNQTSWIAIFYILVGILLILGIDYYGRKRK